MLLRQELDEEKDDIYEAQELYVTLGVMDEDDDLHELLLAVYGEGVTGMFDTEEEKLYVVKDVPEFGPEDALTVAHEFVHGLQQQHFDIEATQKRLERNSDASAAFAALVEGDAVLSQTLYMFQHMSEDEQAVVQEEYRDLNPEAFAAAPHAVQRAVAFPYVEGPAFVLSLYMSSGGWEGVDRALEDIPLSTEHVLHPEKYLSREPPSAVRLPDIDAALGDAWDELARDTLGEFFLLAYLETWVGRERAADAAEGWGGDTYALLTGPQDRNLLASLIAWDSENDAQEFFDTFLDLMRNRTGERWQMVSGDEKSWVMSLPEQRVFLGLGAAETLLILAPDGDSLETAMSAIPLR